MEDTEQFNIRLSKALLYDLEFISQHLRISRNDWIRLNLAKIIMDAKEEIIGKFEDKYVEGYLTNKEFKGFVGFNPSEGMKELKKKLIKNKEVGENIFRKYVEEFNDGDGKSYLDKYMKGVIKKVEKMRKKNVR